MGWQPSSVSPAAAPTQPSAARVPACARRGPTPRPDRCKAARPGDTWGVEDHPHPGGHAMNDDQLQPHDDAFERLRGADPAQGAAPDLTRVYASVSEATGVPVGDETI